MAITYPMALNDFINLLPIRSVSMKPIANTEFSRTRAGQYIVAEYGPTLWAGKVTLGRCYHADARRARALLSAVEEAQGSFIMTDPAYPGPVHGTVTGGTPRATQITRNDIRMAGLPASFKLTAGDLFSIAYGANPVRYSVHMITNERIANTNGEIPGQINITPQIPFAVAGTTDVNVELNRPIMVAKIVPGSVELGDSYSVISDGASFEFQQVIGA